MELDESAFSPKGVAFNRQRAVDGKVKTIVTPKGAPHAFFLRVKKK